ncbi:MAG TPA: hypothetical protein VHF45_07135 [Thermoleophilaceae bacterium]|nr:hypothetical protein [Thermoleophilaceae bacterium]
MERFTAPEWQGEGPPAAPSRPAVLPTSAELFAGAVAAAVAALVLIELRFDGDWPAGVLLAVAAVGFTAVFGLGLRGGRPAAGPPSHRSALLIAGLVLLVVVLARLVDLLTDGDSPEVAVAVAAGAFVVVAAGIGLAYRSAACTLMAAIGVGVLVLALVAAADDPDSERPFAWAFVTYTGVMLGGGVLLRAFDERRHSTQLANAAAIALILFAYGVDLFFGFESIDGEGGGYGLAREWEVALIVGSLGTLLFGLFFRERGPAWGGGAALAIAVFSVSGEADETPTLVGWPVFLIAAALLLAVAAGLRGRAERR